MIMAYYCYLYSIYWPAHHSHHQRPCGTQRRRAAIIQLPRDSERDILVQAPLVPVRHRQPHHLLSPPPPPPTLLLAAARRSAGGSGGGGGGFFLREPPRPQGIAGAGVLGLAPPADDLAHHGLVQNSVCPFDLFLNGYFFGQIYLIELFIADSQSSDCVAVMATSSRMQLKGCNALLKKLATNQCTLTIGVPVCLELFIEISSQNFTKVLNVQLGIFGLSGI
mmetsp:Transcript_44447/g.76846  ORF Transcript_44447/g.76846 Transcript_44447/m.76846 type:complete len:222 (-) Transcript_44447:363-1028(-)